MVSLFQVDGKPFFPLGAQVKNSSSCNLQAMEMAWKGLELLHANFVEIPLHWEQIEPIEGQFDFTLVEQLLEESRKHGLKVAFLWFATWKNGTMKYAPSWVKSDPERFKRVIASDGQRITVLSSHCEENWKSDSKAFRALMKKIRELDPTGRTVIAIQVQNEPGSLGSDRDYGKEAEAELHSPVPAGLVEAIRNESESEAFQVWQSNGGKESGAWEELFGWKGGEYMTAWSIARYIDHVAEAGKEEYAIPMFTNVWLRHDGWFIAGSSYPSGGPTDNVLPIWKWAAPHLDTIGVDNYIMNSVRYRDMNQKYARPDNPLFIPESSHLETNARNIFYALAQGTIGFAVFGVERVLDSEGGINPLSRQMIGSMSAISKALPLLLKYQGTGCIHPIVQEEGEVEMRVDLGDYMALIQFTTNKNLRRSEKFAPEGDRGRGMIIQTEPNEFYVVGIAFKVFLCKKKEPRFLHTLLHVSEDLSSRFVNFIKADEGKFTEQGEWEVSYRRNGDETDYGLWMNSDYILHVIVGE